MRQVNRAAVWRIATTYTGTIIGAGFATGQELLQFFAAYGSIGLLGIVISVVLLTWLGIYLLHLGHRLHATGYHQLQYQVCGPRLGRVLEFCTLVFLFGGLTIMLAGFGLVYQEYLHLSIDTGLVIGTLSIGMIVFCGFRGISTANIIIIPVLIICVIILCINSLQYHHISTDILRIPALSDTLLPNWIVSCLVYVAYNLMLGATVLGPLGSNTQTHHTRVCGGLLGGLMLLGMSLPMVTVILLHLEQAKICELPILLVANVQEGWSGNIYAFTLIGAMLTTAVASLYGCVEQIKTRWLVNRGKTIVILLLSAYAISKLGFTWLVATIYPFFGYVALLFVGKLIWNVLGGIE